MRKYLAFLILVSCGGSTAIPSNDGGMPRRVGSEVTGTDANRGVLDGALVDSGVDVSGPSRVDAGVLDVRGVDGSVDAISVDAVVPMPDSSVVQVDSPSVPVIDAPVVRDSLPVDVLTPDMSGGTRAIGAACDTADQCISGVCFSSPGMAKRCCERDCGECGTCVTGYCEKRGGACGNIKNICSDSCNLMAYVCSNFVCQRKMSNCCDEAVCSSGRLFKFICLAGPTEGGCSNIEPVRCPSGMCAPDNKSCL